MNWRSPPMLPPRIDPAEVRQPTDPAALAALGIAWRLRALAHGLAHGLRCVSSSRHRAVVARVDALLAASDAMLATDALRACGEDPDRLVRAQLAREPLPSPESWAETALADVLLGSALSREVAGRVDLGTSFGAAAIAELAADVPNRTCLQLLVDRWAATCAEAIGSEDARVAWLVETERLLEPWGLCVPDADFMGIEAKDWTPSRRPARNH